MDVMRPNPTQAELATSSSFASSRKKRMHKPFQSLAAFGRISAWAEAQPSLESVEMGGSAGHRPN